MTTFTEEVVAALRTRGWEIYRMEEHGFEWWWKPSEHKDYWTEKDGSRRDWYMPFKDAIGQALVDDMLAARREPLIPRGTGKIICDEKHGEREFDTALDVIRERLEEGYWYLDWTGRDNPDDDPELRWQQRAETIARCGTEEAALLFLIARRSFEYERFYFEHPEPSNA